MIKSNIFPNIPVIRYAGPLHFSPAWLAFGRLCKTGGRISALFRPFCGNKSKGKASCCWARQPICSTMSLQKLEKGIKLKLWVKDVNLAKIFKTYDSRVCFTNKQWTSSNFVEHPIKMKIFLKLQWKSNHEQCLGSELSCKKLQNLLCHGGRACWEIS